MRKDTFLRSASFEEAYVCECPKGYKKQPCPIGVAVFVRSIPFLKCTRPEKSVWS